MWISVVEILFSSSFNAKVAIQASKAAKEALVCSRDFNVYWKIVENDGIWSTIGFFYVSTDKSQNFSFYMFRAVQSRARNAAKY